MSWDMSPDERAIFAKGRERGGFAVSSTPEDDVIEFLIVLNQLVADVERLYEANGMLFERHGPTPDGGSWSRVQSEFYPLREVSR